MGKGSTPRPIFDRHSYENNWDAIFGKKSEETPPKEKEIEDANKPTEEL